MSPWKGHGRPAAVRSVRFKWGGASPLSSVLAAAAAVGGPNRPLSPSPDTGGATPPASRTRPSPGRGRPVSLRCVQKQKGQSPCETVHVQSKVAGRRGDASLPGGQRGLWFRRILSEVRALSGVAGAWLLSHGPGCGHLPAGGRSCPHAIRSSGDDTEWAPIAGL